MQVISGWRALTARYGFLRYVQVIPVALLLWATDAVDRFRPDVAAAGMRNALSAATVSRQLGGQFMVGWNTWLSGHVLPAMAASWYYIVLHGAIAGLVGIALIWRRVPSFPLHRNALIACNLIGLAVFLLYPVAPPRMLPGFHDTTGTSVPVFSSMLESKAASQFASLPSLHVAWALWVAIAATALLYRHRVLRVLVWLYPVATTLDVLATANHYLLDIILANVDHIVEVTEKETARAMRAYYEDTHNVAEGASAAALAGLLKEREMLRGKRVGVVLTGGNIDRELFLEALGGA